MAWIVKLGPAAGQVEYRLAEHAGCGLAEVVGDGLGEAAEPDDAVLAYRMADRGERALMWIGSGLAEFGIEPGSDLVSAADKDTARAIMDGVDPRTGEVLLQPKMAAHPGSRLRAAPYVEALRTAAEERGVPVSELPASRKAAARIARMVRGVHREGDAHRVPAGDLAAIATATGVGLDGVFDPDELAAAMAFVDARVRVGNRGYELALDVPKSTSVLYGIGGKDLADGIEDEWVATVVETTALAEAWASYGMTGTHGRGRSATRVESSGFSGWVMWHGVARPVEGAVPDPHLHAHVNIANLVHCEPHGWFAPGNGGMELHQGVRAFGAFAQARMRHRLIDRYGLVHERDPQTGAWELTSVDQRARAVLSKRAAQVENQLLHDGVDPAAATSAQRKLAAAKTREAKPGPAANQAANSTASSPGDSTGSAGTSVDNNRQEPHALEPVWRAELAAAGLDPDAIVAAALAGGASVGQDLSAADLGARLFDPESGLTAYRKRIGPVDLVAGVCDASPSGVRDYAHVEKLVDGVLAHPDCPVVKLPPGPAFRTHNVRYTTADIVAAEISGITAARDGFDAATAVIPGPAAEAALAAFARSRGFELSAEQRQVAMRLMTGGHAVDAVIGVAGSGKTTLMSVVRAAYTGQGLRVCGAATAAVAAAGLQAETGIPSATIATWLRRIEGGGPDGEGLADVDVLVIDEGAMVDDRQLAALLDAARPSPENPGGTKVIGIGDPLQLRAVGVGGLFAGIHRQVGGLTLYENRRQRDAEHRRGLRLWRDGQVDEALWVWARAGMVHDGQLPADTMDTLIDHWAQARAALYAGPGAAYMDVHEELNRVLILAGSNVDVDRLNQLARAHRRGRGEIVGDDHLYRRDDGTTIALAVGDHVRVRQNDYRTRRKNPPRDAVDVLNGYRGRITAIGGDGAVQVEWRRLLPGGATTDERQWLTAGYIRAGGLTHGTAMTVASAQGVTCNIALIYGLNLDPNSLYSAMARSREPAHLYLPRLAVETPAHAATFGDPADADDALARTLHAYRDTLSGGPDTLVITDLGMEPRPLAEAQPPPPGPEPDLTQVQTVQYQPAERWPSAQAARPAGAGRQRLPQAQPVPSPGEASHDSGRWDRRADRVPPWTQRPYGHVPADQLTAAIDTALRRQQRRQEHADNAVIDAWTALRAAQTGHGPRRRRLTQRLQALQHAAEAGQQARHLDAQINALQDEQRADHNQQLRLYELRAQPLIKRLITAAPGQRTRRQLTTAADTLAERMGRWTEEIERLRARAADAHHRGRHPDDTQPRSHPGRDSNNATRVMADLHRTRTSWDDLAATAIRDDVADATAQVDTATAAAAAAGHLNPRVLALIEEMATRSNLPDQRHTSESTERHRHHIQQQQAQRAARQQQARRGPTEQHEYDPGYHHRHRYGPEHGGPSYGR
ncbi:AAA family ATPase [Actinomadura sp. 6N118]|uniref:AAA family ATPase n=1 Tax=Actinomadura sp. 6N118 TaxID=3375151 RepID=UPI0037B3BCD5